MVDVTTGEGRATRYTVERTAPAACAARVLAERRGHRRSVVDGDGTRTLTLPSGEMRVTRATSDPRFGEAVSRARAVPSTDAVGQDRPRSTYELRRVARPRARLRPTSLTSTAITRPRHDHAPPTTARRDLHDDHTRRGAGSGDDARRARAPGPRRGRRPGAGASAPVDVTYDAAGSRELTQGTQVTRYEHDAAGRVTAIVAADGQRWSSATTPRTA